MIKVINIPRHFAVKIEFPSFARQKIQFKCEQVVAIRTNKSLCDLANANETNNSRTKIQPKLLQIRNDRILKKFRYLICVLMRLISLSSISLFAKAILSIGFLFSVGANSCSLAFSLCARKYRLIFRSILFPTMDDGNLMHT